MSRLESLVVLWRRPNYGGSCKTSPCGKFATVKIGRSLALIAGFDAATCLVSSLWFSCCFAVSMGEAARPLLFGGFQAGCSAVLRGRRGTLGHSNLFDNASICDIPTCLITCRKSWAHTFPTFSQDDLQFLWQAQHFGRVHRHFAWQAQHFRRVVLRVFSKSHCQGCVNGATSLRSILYTLHFTLYTLHFTLDTLHLTLHTPHFTTLYHTLPHFILYTLHSTLDTLHSTLHTLHSTLYT